MRHNMVKSAVVRGAVKCDSSVVVPYERVWTTDKNGKEKERVLAFTFRLPARCATVTDAIEHLWKMPYNPDNVKTLILVKLPNVDKEQTHVKVAPRWIPKELGIFVAFMANYAPPVDATRIEVDNVLRAAFPNDSTFSEYLERCFPSVENRTELKEAIA